MYYCEYCKKPIIDLKDGGVLKVRSSNNQFERGIVVHKGDCDDILSNLFREQGKNTNGFMQLETLLAFDGVEKYRVTGELPE